MCVALKGALISTHHNLADIVFASIAKTDQGWTVYRELTLTGLQGLPVPAAAMADWSRMCDELMDCDLEIATEAELALASGIRRKRPDGWAVHWGRRRVRILEFTRCNDNRSDWRETTEEYKTTRYQPLRDKMAAGLPPAWSVYVSDLLGREVAYGPTGTAYQYDGILVATDGSLKEDGSMGAAFVSMEGCIPARSVTLFGLVSSTRPELTAIALALETCPSTDTLLF